MVDERRNYPDRIYAGHLGGGRRIWKPELMDASEKAFSCEYVRADIVEELHEALAGLTQEVRLHIETNEVIPAADQRLMEAEAALQARKGGDHAE